MAPTAAAVILAVRWMTTKNRADVAGVGPDLLLDRLLLLRAARSLGLLLLLRLLLQLRLQLRLRLQPRPRVLSLAAIARLCLGRVSLNAERTRRQSSRDFTKAPTPYAAGAAARGNRPRVVARRNVRTCMYRENNRTIRFVPTTRVSRVFSSHKIPHANAKPLRQNPAPSSACSASAQTTGTPPA